MQLHDLHEDALVDSTCGTLGLGVGYDRDPEGNLIELAKEIRS